MIRCVLVLAIVAIVGCAHPVTRNEATAKYGRHTQWKASVTAATFHAQAPVTITLGDHLSVVIPSCYAHAQSKIGDHDAIAIAIDGTAATAGEVDITDCTTKHVIATLWATLPDGLRVEAAIDTDLVDPGK